MIKDHMTMHRASCLQRFKTCSEGTKSILSLAHCPYRAIFEITCTACGPLSGNCGETKAARWPAWGAQAEMEGRQEAFERLQAFGAKLLREKHGASDVVEEGLGRLAALRRALGAAWQERARLLRQGRDLQLFREQAKQAEAWLSAKEAVLNNEDLGVSTPTHSGSPRSSLHSGVQPRSIEASPKVVFRVIRGGFRQINDNEPSLPRPSVMAKALLLCLLPNTASSLLASHWHGEHAEPQ